MKVNTEKKTIKKMINFISIIIIILSFILIACNQYTELGTVKKNNEESEKIKQALENKKTFKMSEIKCNEKNGTVSKKIKVKYDSQTHEVALKQIIKNNRNVKTEVYIDSNLINTFDTGKIQQSQNKCEILRSNIYVIDSKYLTILIGEYKDNEIIYKLYFYNNNELVNKEGEQLFIYKQNLNEESVDESNQAMELENVEFDGKNFKRKINCGAFCDKELITFNGKEVVKEIEQPEDQILPDM